MIKSLPIYFDDLTIQKRISSILSNYDDLIDNNTRRIKVLEKTAKLIYEEWFVKFKFPDHEKTKFINSDLGKIPGNWEIVKLKDFLELISR